MKSIGQLVVVLAVTFISTSVYADVRLANIFGDNMVLQRGQEVMIFGWSDPGSSVEVTLDEQIVTVKADKNGTMVWPI